MSSRPAGAPALIETPRLALRAMSLDADLDFVAAMLAHAEVMRYYPRRYTRDEARTWIERQLVRYARDGHGLWIATERATGASVGQVGVVRQSVGGRDEDEVGYLLHRPYWGRGYASEAAAAVRDHAFAVLGRERVISLVRPVNRPSRRVAERLGMSIVGRTLHAGLEHLVFGVSRP